LPGFYAGLAAWVAQRVGATVQPAELAALPLPDWLRMNIRVLDAQERLLAEDRDLAALRRKVLGKAVSTRQSSEESAALHRHWDFGELPPSRQVERHGLTLTMYPAIEDRGGAVAWVEARGARMAEKLSRRGVARLALLALPQQARYWSKRSSEDRELMLQSRGLELAQPLADALVQRIFLEAFMPAEAPLPRSREAFDRRLQEGRAGLEEAGHRVTETVRIILRDWRCARASLDAARNPASGAAVVDIKTQLTALLPPDFIESTPSPWFGHLPRYLEAISRRLARLPAQARRDEESAARIRPFVAALGSLQAESPPGASRPELEQLRWMVEEFRVSLFAQELRTVMRVSERRLGEQLERATGEARG
jgi:ATP-dependent RNA helicase HrpA